LAVISAPDLDQQLAQARAQFVQRQAHVAQADAEVKVAHDNASRSAQTAKDGWTPEQQANVDRDTLSADIAALAVARASVLAQQAQVGRLEQLTSSETVIASFDGVITSRQGDVSSLVTASEPSGTSLFSIADRNVPRVLIYVPQNDFFGMKDGREADITVPKMPDRAFHGRHARNASVPQPETRAVLAEGDVDRPSEGAASESGGDRALPHRDVRCRWAPRRIGRQRRVRLPQITFPADNGAAVEVRSGLRPEDQVILDPPIGVPEGARVKITASSTPRVASMSAEKGWPTYEPVTGHVRVEGSANALLDTGLGMNVGLTGRESRCRSLGTFHQSRRWTPG
jgi:multidrug efflux pump subunit AcrA (membrane-fusion protein)